MTNELYSERQLINLIKRTESDIADDKIRLSQIEPQFKDIEINYLKELKEITEIRDVLREDENLLRNLTAIKSGKKPSEIQHLLRPTSHVDEKQLIKTNRRMKEGEKFKWTKLAKEVLLTANRFMSKEDIFSTIVTNNPELTRLEQTRDSQLAKHRGNFWITLSGNIKDNITPTFCIYREKIGIVAWLSEDKHTPIPMYIKDFMYQAYQSSSNVIEQTMA